MNFVCPYKRIFWKRYINSIYKEIFRKSIHLCTAFIPLLLNYFYLQVELLLILAVIAFSVSEVLRLHGIEIPVVSDITKVASRKRDEGKFVLGPVTLVFGIVISSILFDKTSYTIGILSLAFGDGTASLCGKLFGLLHIPGTQGKTVAGSLSCFLAIFCSSFFVCKSVFISLVIATAGMLIEVLPLKDLDNLIIPVILSMLAQFLLK